MQKIDRSIKKRWLYYVLINMVVLLVVFGAFLAGFAVFTVNSNKRAAEKQMKGYADSLSEYSLSTLIAYCNGDLPDTVIEFENPNFHFAVYAVRGDGSFSLYTKSAFLANINPGLIGYLNEPTEEDIGGYNFLTYTANVQDSAGSYVKVFAPNEYMKAAGEYISTYGIPFWVGFVLITVAMSLVWGYFEIKPVITNYYKQKSLISDISHEIRTPLAIIKGNLENIAAMPDGKISDVTDVIESCLQEIDYMNDISSGLLDIVRGESKGAKKDAVMSDAVSEIVEIYSDAVSMSNRALVASIEQCSLQIDREKIKQLLTILLENAIKYTREGDRINIKLKNTKDGCQLSVSDTGIGVPQTELDMIFERFYRAENAKDMQGTGLGLAIAKSIVESLNGSIRAVQNMPTGLEIIVQLKRN